MARHIDSDEAKRAIKANNWRHPCVPTVVGMILDRIPTADVVEVVRCKDCKHSPDIKTKTKGMVWCRKFRTEVRPNGFCSYGERRPPEDKP